MDVLFQTLSFFKGPAADSAQVTVLEQPDKEKVMEERRTCIGSKVDMFYRKDPLLVSAAKAQFVYDEQGRQFLDCVSNVQHVGHCHPKVVQRVSQQMMTSNCNIRFLSSQLTDAAKALLATLPAELDTVLFVNSGSEANDLALRMAKDYTNNTEVICLDHAYHGHLVSTMQVSPYKFDHGSSIPKPEWVHVAPTPDAYRGKYRLSDENLQNDEKLVELGEKYSSDLSNQLQQEVFSKGLKVSAYIAEALQSCGGQVIPPKGYMTKVAKLVRENGGLMIIDEVQTGFGRVGQTFWAHRLQDNDFVPDIITMGKPMGNGFPVSAVVTKKKIADSLGGQVGYFNTFGGNPVSCAAVLAVLETLKEENLVEHSEKMGDVFRLELNKLKDRHPVIGDVRGVGMFWGLDLVTDRQSRTPATNLASDLCLMLKTDYGVLLNSDGPHSNILKFKPPLCFNEDDLKKAISAIDKALSRLT